MSFEAKRIEIVMKIKIIKLSKKFRMVTGSKNRISSCFMYMAEGGYAHGKEISYNGYYLDCII